MKSLSKHKGTPPTSSFKPCRSAFTALQIGLWSTLQYGRTRIGGNISCSDNRVMQCQRWRSPKHNIQMVAYSQWWRVDIFISSPSIGNYALSMVTISASCRRQWFARDTEVGESIHARWLSLVSHCTLFHAWPRKRTLGSQLKSQISCRDPYHPPPMRGGSEPSQRPVTSEGGCASRLPMVYTLHHQRKLQVPCRANAAPRLNLAPTSQHFWWVNVTTRFIAWMLGISRAPIRQTF